MAALLHPEYDNGFPNSKELAILIIPAAQRLLPDYCLNQMVSVVIGNVCHSFSDTSLHIVRLYM